MTHDKQPDLRKMKTSQLINRMAHTSERQAQAARDEIDRRFPVPVERVPSPVDVMFKDTGSRVKQEAAKARAESKGGGGK